MEPQFLSPCCPNQSQPSNSQHVGAGDRSNDGGGRGKGCEIASRRSKKASSSSSSCSSFASRHQKGGGVRLRTKRSNPTPSTHEDESFEDLALPLGMSFAAVLAQVLDWNNDSQERLPVDRLSMICTSAVKESLHIVYGDRYDCFMRNFEKSFGSTLKTLQSINETSRCGQEKRSISETSDGNAVSSLFESSKCGAAPSVVDSVSLSGIEEFQGNLAVSSLNNQLILHGQINQQLAHVSRTTGFPGFNESILNTIEKSIMEQTRSNDLKEVEIGLTMRKLQFKQSQLALSAYTNFLEKVKISMGISKAFFKEGKLRNQMQDVRYAELHKKCIDLLLSGLIVVSSCLIYGTCIYSYHRIIEATSACKSTPKESKSWWMPKPMASFSSGWLMLRCHVVALSRVLFGVSMMSAVAYLFFQRSASSGAAMPVTFILLLLGVACGGAGKVCIDTLGGNGYRWLLYWEIFCLLHFIAGAFPSILYHILYGPVSVTGGGRAFVVPYWVRRTICIMLLLTLPAFAGLLPFAPLDEWTVHFAEKITRLFENQE